MRHRLRPWWFEAYSFSFTLNSLQFWFSPFSNCSTTLLIPHTINFSYGSRMNSCERGSPICKRYLGRDGHAHGGVFALLELIFGKQIDRSIFPDVVQSLKCWCH